METLGRNHFGPLLQSCSLVMSGTSETTPVRDEECRRLRRELDSVRTRHRVAVNDLRGSIQYRIGEMIVDLRAISGWRRLPSRLLGIAKLILQKRGQRRRRPYRPFVSSPNRSDISGVTVLDEFSQACWGAEFKSIALTRSAPSETLNDAEFFFVESVWEGPESSWRYTMSSGRQDDRLQALISAARERGIPAIFWNKEDPTNYDRFIDTAKGFDWVFTTDRDCLDSYREDLGHSQVASLMFAAQPKLHNPIGSNEFQPSSICFAGSWRGAKYPDRGAQLEFLLDAAQKSGDLVIFDRESQSATSTYPSRFTKNVRPALHYNEMLAEYRRHAVFLNTNSVETSSTMLSRRVFELLACGTPVVSGPSLAVQEIFGGLVPVVESELEAVTQFSQILDDPVYRRELSHLGYRFVHTQHTYAHRLGEIGEFIGVKTLSAVPDPWIDWICVSERPEMLQNIVSNYRRQTYQKTRLMVVLNNDRYDKSLVEELLSDIPNSRVISVAEEMTLGDCLNIALSETESEFFAKIDDDDFYGDHYLSDLVLATKYADASIFGKRSIYALMERDRSLYLRNGGFEFSYTDFVAGGTLLVRRSDVQGVRFKSVVSGTDSRFLEDSRTAGLRIFSADRFNYVMRRRFDIDSHTWKIQESDFLQNAVLEKRDSRVEDAQL